MATEYILYTFIATILILLVWIVRLEIRMTKLLRGKNARNLEDTIVAIGEELTNLRNTDSEHAQCIGNMEERLKRCIQGTSVLRFNPFKDVGSNQSFATALLNEHGHGIVVSSLYSRDHMSVFAKPIRGHNSEYDLTPEELSAIEKARL